MSSSTALVGVKAPHGSRVIELKWGDGRAFSLPHRIVRGYCPCAGCQGHSGGVRFVDAGEPELRDRKSTRLNSSHQIISYAVFCLKKKKNIIISPVPPTRCTEPTR